jgi:hypothetical protein
MARQEMEVVWFDKDTFPLAAAAGICCGLTVVEDN